MKRAPLICVIILLFGILLLAGCTMRETSPADPVGRTEGPAASPEATATPEPIPTPAPIDLIIGQSAPSYVIPADSGQLRQALEIIENNNGQSLWAQKGNWHVDGLTEAQLTGTRMEDRAPAGDIMTSDGQYLYLLADKDLVILKLSPDSPSVLSRIKIGEDWSAWEDTSGQAVNGSEKIPSAVFCRGDRLAIVSDYYNYSSKGGDTGYTEYTAVQIYDVSDRTAPVMLSECGQDGAPVYAGFSGDAFVLVTDWQYGRNDGDPDPSAVIPASRSQGQTTVIDPEKLLAVTDGRDADCSVMGVYDLAAGRLADSCAVYGAPADPFVGNGEILFYVSRVAEGFSRSYNDPEKGSATEFAAAACTDLYRFVLDKSESDSSVLRFDGVYTVEGAVGDSRCLDRYEGQLRCAAIKDERRRTDYENGLHEISRLTSCDIVLLDGSLHSAAAAADLADGNTDCWIAYLGDRAVVTQEAGSNLARLSGGDASHDVIKLSRSVRAHAIRSLGVKGCSAFYRSEAGKLTLTVYDAAMEPLFERSFGSDHSSTLENQAGYFADGETGVVAFSADDSYCVYSFDAEKGLTLKGNVYLSDWAWNARGFVLDGMLYVADTRELFIYNLSDFSVVNQIKF